MRCGANRITHIVQTIEHCDQVIVFAWICFGFRDAKVGANLEALFNGSCASALDRFVVIVKTKELRFWKGFSHQHCGCTLATPYIGDARPGLELCLNAVQGRNPRTD